MNILIVEKNPNLSCEIQKILEPFSNRIDIFKHGFFAIQAIKKIHYDIAIINREIGVESGFFIARSLEKINPQLKIILFSKRKMHAICRKRAIEKKYFFIEQVVDLNPIKNYVKKILEVA